MPPRQVVEHAHADVDEKLWQAAESSVRAQLAYPVPRLNSRQGNSGPASVRSRGYRARRAKRSSRR